MNEAKSNEEIVDHALNVLADKWDWRAQHHMVAGNLTEAARLMEDADALRKHVASRS